MLWPLVGAAIVLGLRRWLPGWLQRLIAAAAAAASLATLWSLSGDAQPQAVNLPWGSLDFFRMGLAFYPHGLSTLAGIVLAGVTAAAALGISPSDAGSQKTNWHGLILVALSGALAALLAANLLTLAFGSGLLVLAVVGLAAMGAPSGDEYAWPALGAAVPGVAATLLIYLSALQMDAHIGHASLQGRTFSPSALAFLGAAGVLWLLAFPLRAASRLQEIVSWLLPCGTGLYLLARVVSIAAAVGASPFGQGSPLLVLGGAMLLAGGMLAWLYGVWPGMAIHQAGYGLVFIALWGGSQAGAARPAMPWPLAGLALTLGALAISASAGDGGNGAGGQSPARRWAGLARLAQWTGLAWLAERVKPWWAKARSAVASRLRLRRPRLAWLGRLLAALLPAVALASLAGLPLTVGAAGRWRLYGGMLGQEQAGLLLVVLLSDSLLVAGLWAVLRTLDPREDRVSLPRLAAMILLVAGIILWGVAPGRLLAAVGLTSVQATGVSVWGIGLLYVLPWLVGTWLAYAGARRPAYADRLRQVARGSHAGQIYRAVAWAGAQVAGALHWLGQVGEGGGWWGWALIVLAVGVLLTAAR